MTIETKYNIGDEVWFMHENRVHKSKIGAIYITLYDDMRVVKYSFGNYILEFKENEELYRTKEELLKSL